MSKQTGTIKKFIENKGFGFIEGTANDDIFFHINDCPAITPEALSPGVEVSYEITTDRRDKTKAINLEVAE